MGQASVDDRAGYRVKQVQQLLRQACDIELRPTGLSMSQYSVLQVLADHPAVSSAELARRCFVTRQSLGDVLSGLQSAGLVAIADRVPGERARPVSLTSAGRVALDEADALIGRVEERMLDGLAPGRRATLVELLAACAGNLGNGVARS